MSGNPRKAGREQGYADALRDAVDALKALPVILVDARPDTFDQVQYRQAVLHGDAIAAIEALGGER